MKKIICILFFTNLISPLYAEMANANLTEENLIACKQIRYELNPHVVARACEYDYAQGTLANYLQMKNSSGYSACTTVFNIDECQQVYLSWQKCHQERKEGDNNCFEENKRLQNYERLAITMQTANYQYCTKLGKKRTCANQALVGKIDQIDYKELGMSDWWKSCIKRRNKKEGPLLALTFRKQIKDYCLTSAHLVNENLKN